MCLWSMEKMFVEVCKVLFAEKHEDRAELSALCDNGCTNNNK